VNPKVRVLDCCRFDGLGIYIRIYRCRIRTCAAMTPITNTRMIFHGMAKNHRSIRIDIRVNYPLAAPPQKPDKP
jgi:hypothetical protein